MDDKKKIIAMVALFLVVVGVGAFQFMSGSGPAPATPAKKTAETPANADQAKGAKGAKGAEGTEAEAAVHNPVYANALPTRDPFKEESLAPPPVAPQNTVRQPAQRSPKTRSGGSVAPFRPDIQLPPASGNIGLAGIAPPRNPNAFTLSLKGVILGDRPAAVFQDENGNQRLVSLGSSVDGDSKVTGISPSRVTVRHKGKTVTLTVGANTNGN